MPKKLDYREEIRSLKGAPDGALRPVTTRVPVRCLRKLYELCDRGNTDLSTLVRRILEEQADLYLGGQNVCSSQFRKDKSAAPQDTQVLLHLPAEIKELADKASEGLAIDLPTLLRLIIGEALPGWVMKASKAQQQRRQARDHLENQLSPERAAWKMYFQLALPQDQSDLRPIENLIEDGLATLELNNAGVLFLVLDYEKAVELENGTADHPGVAALQGLISARVLIQEPSPQGACNKWRIVPRAVPRNARGKT